MASEPDTPPPTEAAEPVSAVSQRLIDAVMRELEEYESLDAQIARVLTNGTDEPGPDHSVAFSIRLDSRELAALRMRAASMQLGPSVLARNLIRIGVRGRPDSDAVTAGVARLEDAVAQLRALLM